MGFICASEHGPLDGNEQKPLGAGHPAPLTLAESVTLRVVRRLSIRPALLSILLSIRPPLLSILPSILSTFDAGLVAGAGRGKRASRSGCQGEQERSSDPLSGNRREGVFHTI